MPFTPLHTTSLKREDLLTNIDYVDYVDTLDAAMAEALRLSGLATPNTSRADIRTTAENLITLLTNLVTAHTHLIIHVRALQTMNKLDVEAYEAEIARLEALL